MNRTRLNPPAWSARRLAVAVAASAVCLFGAVGAQAQTELSREALMNARGSTAEQTKISDIREQALRETAAGLGTRFGLMERSREIIAETNRPDNQVKLDRQYGFGGLMMGPGLLPPVIMKTEQLIALENATMTVAGVHYKFDEGARFVAVAPTWRDWLFLGLVTDDSVDMASLRALLPRDSNEQAFYQARLNEAIANGRAQAQQIYNLNAARLEKTYVGMRLYYELWQSGVVKAPIVASSATMVERNSPNSITVGNMIYRITQQADFQAPDKWRPLE